MSPAPHRAQSITVSRDQQHHDPMDLLLPCFHPATQLPQHLSCEITHG